MKNTQYLYYLWYYCLLKWDKWQISSNQLFTAPSPPYTSTLHQSNRRHSVSKWRPTTCFCCAARTVKRGKSQSYSRKSASVFCFCWSAGCCLAEASVWTGPASSPLNQPQTERTGIFCTHCKLHQSFMDFVLLYFRIGKPFKIYVFVKNVYCT